ncbi:MAG TPA: ABC transporter permease subunit [Blastocatellia bacterium]|nr:ABC transporter permease subunit [Blastocatellia bacterium]
MSVYEHSYKPYSGALTPAWSRFLIVPRYAYGDIFQSKFFIGFFATSFVPFLIMTTLVYLRHNLRAVEALGMRVSNLVPIDGAFFMTYCSIQQFFIFVLAIVIGPVLISRDLANNALPLYLARPLSRSEYIGGKLSVLVILMSVMTWIPGLFMFVIQSSLEGGSWFVEHLYIAGAIVLSSLAYTLLLSLLVLALSAWVKWRLAGSAALLGLFIIPGAFGGFVDILFKTNWGSIVDLNYLSGAVMRWAFRVERFSLDASWATPPVWFDALALTLVCAACLGVLSMKVKAYEVVQ